MSVRDEADRPPEAVIRFPKTDYKGALKHYHEARQLVLENGLHAREFLVGGIDAPRLNGKEVNGDMIAGKETDQKRWHIEMPFWWSDAAKGRKLLQGINLPAGVVLEFSRVE